MGPFIGKNLFAGLAAQINLLVRVPYDSDPSAEGAAESHAAVGLDPDDEVFSAP
jgi:hypothetical protein